jgi:hypothetical protein
VGTFQDEKEKRSVLLAELAEVQRNPADLPVGMAACLFDKCLLSKFSVEEPDAGNLHVRFREGL